MMKTKVKKNLQNLELHEVVTRKNGYQDLVNMIAQVTQSWFSSIAFITNFLLKKKMGSKTMFFKV